MQIAIALLLVIGSAVLAWSGTAPRVSTYQDYFPDEAELDSALSKILVFSAVALAFAAGLLL
jgi:hypothetical protein